MRYPTISMVKDVKHKHAWACPEKSSCHFFFKDTSAAFQAGNGRFRAGKGAVAWP
jgi:hypothetical protein